MSKSRFFGPGEDIPMLSALTLSEILSVLAIIVSCGSLIVSIGSLRVSLLAYRQAKTASALAKRLEAITHIRQAIGDVTLHDHISGETVTSISEAFRLSQLVFSPAVFDKLDGAHKIAFRLSGKSFDQRTPQQDQDRVELERLLQTTLSAMEKEAAFR
jgi:hypothetical protein